MKYTTQTISKVWTTEISKTEISLTFTVESHDYDIKRIYDLTVSGKKISEYSIKLNDNKLSFEVNGKSTAIMLDADFAAEIRNMVKNAKAEIAPRVTEYNEYQEAMRRMS